MPRAAVRTGGRRRAALLLRVTVGLGLIALLLWTAGPRQLLQSFENLSWGYLGLAFFAQALAKVIWAMRWQEVLKASGIYKGMIELIAMLHVGFFFNNFLPSSMGGDVVRGYYSAAGKGTLATAYGVIVAERLIGFVALAGICAVACVILLLAPSGGIPDPFLLSSLAVSAGILGAGAIVFLTDGWRYIAQHLLRGRPRIAGIVARVSDAVQFAHRPDCRVWLVISLSVMVQVVAVLFYYGAARAVGIHLGLADYFFVVPLAVTASMLPVSPNGIGLREGAFVGLLQLLGVAAPQATAFALLARLVDLAFALIGGAIFMLKLSLREQMAKVPMSPPRVGGPP
jgi:uncharacterized membrane protein YbhN (UPF0104 family)